MQQPAAVPVLALLVAVPAAAQPDVYEEPRDLSLNAEGVQRLRIDTDAGNLYVTGLAQTNTIVVKALIRVPDGDPEEARRIIDSDLVLSLGREGRVAVLEGRFRHAASFAGHEGSVTLEVSVPETLALTTGDGSGILEILNVRGEIDVVDGSGSAILRHVGGDVTVDDGSGTLVLQDVGGDVSIVDGSGRLSVEAVQGSVRIEDGSGGIEVSGVAGDLEIPDAGSGSVSVSDVAGRIDRGD